MPELLLLLLLALTLLLLVTSGMIAWDATHPDRRSTGWALAHRRATDPDDLELPFASWSVTRPRGVEIPAWEVSGDGPPLVALLVHGWGQSRTQALERINAWRPLASRIVLYDLRGHGDAGGCSRLGDREEDDLLAVLDALDGDEPVVVDGHSMGSEIAIHAAAKRRDARIAAVIASGPYRTVHVPLRNRLAQRDYPTRPLTDLALLWLRLAGIRQRDVADACGDLACPLLVIHGADDVISPAEDARAIAAAAPEGRFLELEEVGHGDHHAAPDEAEARRAHAVRALVAEIRTSG
jgi:pimeloyl-ACP methyl ester carboxylesterase